MSSKSVKNIVSSEPTKVLELTKMNFAIKSIDTNWHEHFVDVCFDRMDNAKKKISITYFAPTFCTFSCDPLEEHLPLNTLEIFSTYWLKECTLYIYYIGKACSGWTFINGYWFKNLLWIIPYNIVFDVIVGRNVTVCHHKKHYINAAKKGTSLFVMIEFVYLGFFFT